MWSYRARKDRYILRQAKRIPYLQITDTDRPSIEQSHNSIVYILHTAKGIFVGLTVVDLLPAIDIYQICTFYMH